MKLNHLRYFTAVAEDLSFTKAARRLKMAQPPLSRQIRSLETEIGVQLFERRSGKVLLTDAGCRFFSGYGGRTGQMWSAFAELMASRPSAENEDMLEASVATFELLGDWLESEAHD